MTECIDFFPQRQLGEKFVHGQAYWRRASFLLTRRSMIHRTTSRLSDMTVECLYSRAAVSLLNRFFIT